ncbi:hypothetical protein [Hyalangium versicolor]|uniref:hypothetical protein n=1 Tax=Hyalangium versicolor TaxID=2861190 RepID=UPI001CCBD56B|nr:hypothetical protein [Hyalangium versicolor]
MFALASTALMLLAAAPAAGASPSSGFQLHEGLPVGFKVDGKLDEWKLPPSVTFDASSQVAGKSKIASPQDLSARIWVAVGPEGLAVAGEVKDDKVQLSTSPEQVNNDHVELWLALPQPQMPDVEFVNQFGEHALPTPDSCENNEDIVDGKPEECRKWWKEQAARRKKLVSAFTAQYGLLSGSLVRFDQKGTVGSIRYEPQPDGYRFEALIPPTAFPRSGEAPLRNLRVLVDLVDSDEGTGKLETFLSSSKTRKFGDPSTFHAVTLTQPLRFGTWPELLERAVKADPGTSYQPAPDAHSIEVWINPAVGYQYAPEADSPKVVTVDLSGELSQGKLGDVELLSVPMQSDWRGYAEFWMVSRRGKTVLDAQRADTKELRVAPRAGGLAIIQVYEGTMSALGTGACGACPMLSFHYVKMDAQGRFSKAEELEGAYSEGEELEWEISPNLSKIEAFVAPEEKAPRQLLKRYTWDAKASTYNQEEFKRPEPKEE